MKKVLIIVLTLIVISSCIVKANAVSKKVAEGKEPIILVHTSVV